MRERIGPMRVDAELRDDDVGTERLQERRHHLLEGREVGGRVRIGFQREIHRISDARALARLVHEPGAGEEPLAALVRGDRHHVRVAVERGLHAIAVMRVDVDVCHAQPALAQPHDGQHRVVDVAEAGGALVHRVVEPAREVEGAIDLAPRDQVGREQRAARHEPRAVPHAAEDRVVAGPEPEERGRPRMRRRRCRPSASRRTRGGGSARWRLPARPRADARWRPSAR